jgi:hypothetical protein
MSNKPTKRFNEKAPLVSELCAWTSPEEGKPGLIRLSSLAHEVVAAAASYLGMRAYMKRQEAEGKPER